MLFVSKLVLHLLRKWSSLFFNLSGFELNWSHCRIGFLWTRSQNKANFLFKWRDHKSRLYNRKKETFLTSLYFRTVMGGPTPLHNSSLSSLFFSNSVFCVLFQVFFLREIFWQKSHFTKKRKKVFVFVIARYRINIVLKQLIREEN